MLARREQRFQEQKPVFQAPCTIPLARMARDQIEVQRYVPTRIVTIIHAEKRYDAKRDRAHGHERAEGDLPPEEAMATIAGRQRRREQFAHHVEFQRFVDPRARRA